MDKTSNYHCVDGRAYTITMSWDDKFKDADLIFRAKFKAVDHATNRELKLPKEIATYAIGDPAEPMGERAKYYYGGDRELLVSDYLTSAYRRACDWIERGK